MSDKRFLGLGFTFAATDKGLEKKLVKVHSVLSDISEALDKINVGAKKTSTTLGKIKSPKIKMAGAKSVALAKPGIRKKAGDKYGTRLSGALRTQVKEKQTIANTSFHKKMEAATASKEFEAVSRAEDKMRKIEGTFEELAPKFSSSANSILAGFRKALGKENFDAFFHTMSDVSISLESTGKEFENFTKSTEFKLHKSFENFVKNASAASLLGVNLDSLSKAFHGVKDWVVNVRESLTGFAETLGIDFQKIIPPQLRAGLNVLKSVAMGPVNLAKYLGNKAKEKFNKKFQDRTLTTLGKGTTKKNVISLLDKIEEGVSGEKSGGGFFGKLGEIFGDLVKTLLDIPILGGLLAALFSPLNLLKGAFMFLWDAVMGVVGFFEGNLIQGAIMEAVEALGAALGIAEAPFIAIGAIVVGIVAAIASVAANIYGFAKQVAQDWDKWKSAFSRIGAAIAGIVDNFLQAHPVIKSVLDAISSFVSDEINSIKSLLGDISEILSGPAMLIADAFTSVKNAVVGFVKYIWDLVSGGVGRFLAKGALSQVEGLAGSLESAQASTKPTATNAVTSTISDTKGYAENTLALQQSLIDQGKDHSSKLEDQKQATDQTNDILLQLLNHFEGKQPAPSSTSFKFGFDARKWGFQMDQSSMNDAAMEGS